MKIIKYIFFSLILFIYTDVYATNDINDIKNNLENNDNIIINLDYYNDELIVNRKVLDLIKGKDKTITYNIIDNNKILYNFKFNGKYFNKSYNNISLKISYNSDKDSFINEYFKTNKKIIINTEYKGNYPNGTILSIRNDKSLKKINLYSLDNNKFNIENNVFINKNYIDINIKKGSIYVISNIELVSIETIKIYLLILLLLVIEIIIFLIVIIKKDIKK